MTSEYNIVLNPNKSHVHDSGITLSRGDFGMVFKITVEGLNTSGTTCKIGFRKPSGSVEATGLTASGDTYSYALRGTELDQPGKVIADLKFIENTTKRISTASFTFNVVEDTLDGLSEEAHSYSDSILQMRQQIVEEARADLAPVQYVQQSLTDAQKAQARANIGVASGLVYKGTVATTAQLPATGNQPGDFYVVSANNHAYAWDGNAWRDNGAASGMQDYSGLVGDAWSSSKTYTVGDYAIYNNNLYKAKLQHSNVIPTNTTYWTHVSVANEVSQFNRDLTDIAKYYDGITITLGSFPDDTHRGYNRIGSLVVVNCTFKPTSNIAIDSIVITGFPKSIGRMPVFILDYDNTAITGFGSIDYGGRFRNYITLTANHTYMLSGIYEDLEAR